MKKVLLLSAALMGLSGTVSAQAPIETYSVYDVNHQNGTTVADATEVVSRVIETVTTDPQVVDADVLNGLLMSIDCRLQEIKALLQENNQRLALFMKESNIDYPYENGHEYVDLGITVNGKKLLWAKTNVGAENAWEYGDYFAWGITEPYYTEGHSQDNPCSSWRTDLEKIITGYDWASYKYSDGGSYKLTKYVTDRECGKDGFRDFESRLEASDDAATANWGGAWRMPTNQEQILLLSQCYWQWVTSYSGKSVEGYVVYKAKAESDKGKNSIDNPSLSATYSVSNDVHIFLPKAGSRTDVKITSWGGIYWSSTLSEADSSSGCSLLFDSTGLDCDQIARCQGGTVRPVCVLSE